MGREEPSHISVYRNINAMGRKLMAFFLVLSINSKKGG